MKCPKCKKDMRYLGIFNHEDGRVYERWGCANCNETHAKLKYDIRGVDA